MLGAWNLVLGAWDLEPRALAMGLRDTILERPVSEVRMAANDTKIEPERRALRLLERWGSYKRRPLAVERAGGQGSGSRRILRHDKEVG
jgi:hypothetical protein